MFDLPIADFLARMRTLVEHRSTTRLALLDLVATVTTLLATKSARQVAEPAVVVFYFLCFLLLPVVAPAALTVLLPPTLLLLTGPACALGTVLLGPLVKAVPPMRKLLIAMPGFVFVTV